jgi:hypothetical protein
MLPTDWPIYDERPAWAVAGEPSRLPNGRVQLRLRWRHRLSGVEHGTVLESDTLDDCVAAVADLSNAGPDVADMVVAYVARNRGQIEALVGVSKAGQ